MDSLYISQLKKKALEEKALIVFEDEATFRQTPTLHRTWAVTNHQPKVPTLGQRNSQKILGAVSLYPGQFLYHHQTEYFNSESYTRFMENHLMPKFYRSHRRIYLIQDNASYHKQAETYDWFNANRNRIEVFQLPAYSPEFNAIERLWHYTRMNATHNRYFDTPEELCNTLFYTFNDMQQNPDKIMGLLRPFF